MSVLAAERIKLTSTRSPWWCLAVVIALGLGMAAIIGLSARSSLSAYNRNIADGTAPNVKPVIPTIADALYGISGFGVLVVMILAALSVTSEYRFGTIRTTFQSVPNRTNVLVMKSVLIGVLGAFLTFVLALGAYLLAKANAGSEAGANLQLSSGDAWRAVYSVPIYTFLCVFLAVGVGALLRQSAAAIALLLLWPLLIENLFNLFGSFGRGVMPFLPFLNANQFLGQTPDNEFHWGPWGSLIYFAVFVALVFWASVIAVNSRDA